MFPDEMREAALVLLHDLQPEARAFDRRVDFGAAADDALVLKQAADLPFAEARNLLWFETGEGATEILALAQDGDPRQSSLESVEDKLLIERAVVEFRNAPFLVVIGDVERILARPGATDRDGVHRRLALRFAH